MRETGPSLVKVLSSLTKRFKKPWQLFDSLLSLIEQRFGLARFVWSIGLFRLCRRRSKGADIRPRTRLHGNHLTAKYDELFFISLLCACSPLGEPLERAIKSPPHKEQPKETRYSASTGLLQGSNAGRTALSDVARQKTWHRNLEYSTESEPEKG